MPQTLYENNRRAIARELLGDLSPWQELERKIITYDPAHVILVARRMPRLWQLLQTLGVFRLDGMNIISNFAIPFMRKKLKDSRIAIVDDSLNVGTTFMGVCEDLGKGAKAQCFALSYNRDTAKKPIHEKLDYAIKDGWSDGEYRKKLQKFTEALGLLSLPFELEFPVYKVASDVNTMRDLPGRLLRLGAGCRPQVIDISKKARAGIERYSLDMEPQLGKNNKMRLYVDWAYNTITVVPMFPQEKDANAHWGHLGLYENSAAYADNCWPEISNVLGLGKLLPDQAECRLLFGAKHVDDITEEPDPLLAVSSGGSQKNFLDIVKNWPELDEIAQDPGAEQLYFCLKEFFELLGRKIGSDNPDKMCDDFLEMIKSEGQRLHIGPTFTELCEILRKIWHPPGKFTDADWYARISKTLDQQIDQGFIVPAIGLSGSRIFRKGEACPYDTVSMQILKCLGISSTPENLDAKIDALVGEDKEIYKSLRSVAEKLGGK